MFTDAAIQAIERCKKDITTYYDNANQEDVKRANETEVSCALSKQEMIDLISCFKIDHELYKKGELMGWIWGSLATNLKKYYSYHNSLLLPLPVNAVTAQVAARYCQLYELILPEKCLERGTVPIQLFKGAFFTRIVKSIILEIILKEIRYYYNRLSHLQIMYNKSCEGEALAKRIAELDSTIDTGEPGVLNDILVLPITQVVFNPDRVRYRLEACCLPVLIRYYRAQYGSNFNQIKQAMMPHLSAIQQIAIKLIDQQLKQVKQYVKQRTGFRLRNRSPHKKKLAFMKNKVIELRQLKQSIVQPENLLVHESNGQISSPLNTVFTKLFYFTYKMHQYADHYFLKKNPSLMKPVNSHGGMGLVANNLTAVLVEQANNVQMKQAINIPLEQQFLDSKRGPTARRF